MVRHSALLRWLHGHFPRSKLYGPYRYAGREFLIWRARGHCLIEDVLPLFETVACYDPHVGARLERMRAAYGVRT